MIDADVHYYRIASTFLFLAFLAQYFCIPLGILPYTSLNTPETTKQNCPIVRGENLLALATLLKRWQDQQEKQEGKSCKTTKSPPTDKSTHKPMAEIAKRESQSTAADICRNDNEEISAEARKGEEG